MAKITSFVLCNSINNSPNTPQADGSSTALIAPQVALRPEFIPSNFSFGISVGIQDIDIQKINCFQFTIMDPSGKVIQDSGVAEFPAVNQKDSMPIQYQGVMLSIDIRNLAIRYEGEYVLRVYVNKELAGSCIIPIFRRG